MNSESEMPGMGRRLGMVVAGSLTEGVDVRLDSGTLTEEIKVGTFVNIQGKQTRFLGVLAVLTSATAPLFAVTPRTIDGSNNNLANFALGQANTRRRGESR